MIFTMQPVATKQMNKLIFILNVCLNYICNGLFSFSFFQWKLGGAKACGDDLHAFMVEF